MQHACFTALLRPVQYLCSGDVLPQNAAS